MQNHVCILHWSYKWCAWNKNKNVFMDRNVKYWAIIFSLYSDVLSALGQTSFLTLSLILIFNAFLLTAFTGKKGPSTDSLHRLHIHVSWKWKSDISLFKLQAQRSCGITLDDLNQIHDGSFDLNTQIRSRSPSLPHQLTTHCGPSVCPLRAAFISFFWPLGGSRRGRSVAGGGL